MRVLRKARVDELCNQIDSFLLFSLQVSVGVGVAFFLCEGKTVDSLLTGTTSVHVVENLSLQVVDDARRLGDLTVWIYAFSNALSVR